MFVPVPRYSLNPTGPVEVEIIAQILRLRN
jgi:hypothetical protein